MWKGSSETEPCPIPDWQSPKKLHEAATLWAQRVRNCISVLILRIVVLGTWTVTTIFLGSLPYLRTHSGTKRLQRCLTLPFSAVAQDERHQVGVGILTSLQLSATMLKFSPENERVTTM